MADIGRHVDLYHLFSQSLLIRNYGHFFTVDIRSITYLYVSYNLGAQFQYTPDGEFSL